MKNFILLILFSINIYANNQLQYEESPYLKQHSTDPINWLPWNNKNLGKAKEENKLIFLSIGYSTCHWCHVMQKESFKDKKIAKLLNQNYISIKVDKEESPHLDNYYQNSHIKINNRRKGWPLSVILSPNGEILYITTYIPKNFKYGYKGMNQLIPEFANIYKNNKKRLKKIIKENHQKLNKKLDLKPINKDLIINKYIQIMENRYDKVYKGFNKSPKFPLAKNLELLLDIYSLTKNKKSLNLAINSIDALINSATYDQINGAFFRYSTLADWNMPHFEKMLYTQAEMIKVLYKAYKITKNIKYKQIIEKTIKETNSFFRNKNFLYFSASDADSLNSSNKKEEGYYFLFNYDEVSKLLIKNNTKNYEEVLEYLGFDEFGNFEDKINIPYINMHIKKPKNIEKTIKILKTIQTKRKRPFIDNKIISSWNAIFIQSLFLYSNIEEKYLKDAIKSTNSLLENLYINNTLYHQKLSNRKANKLALLEDYTSLVELLLTAYQRTFDKKYLSLAIKINHQTSKKFKMNNKIFLDENKKYEADYEDRYYQSAISKYFHNNLTIANLTYDLNLLQQTKKLIDYHYNFFSNKIFNSPSSISAFIRKTKGDIILKSNKKRLLSNISNIETIKYPYLLKKEEKTKQFLACDENSCFAFDTQLKNIIKAIDK